MSSSIPENSVLAPIESSVVPPAGQERQSKIVTIRLPSAWLRLLMDRVPRQHNELNDGNNDEESLDGSPQVYSEDKEVHEANDGPAPIIIQDSDDEAESDEHGNANGNNNRSIYAVRNEDHIVHQSIERDESSGLSQDTLPGPQTTPPPYSKLLASCLEGNTPWLLEYLERHGIVTEQFLTEHSEVVADFITKHPQLLAANPRTVESFICANPLFVENYLRRTQIQSKHLFADDPRYYVERYLDQHPHFFDQYLGHHPDAFERYLTTHPLRFDNFMSKYPTFVYTYLHNNRLPSGFGIKPVYFGLEDEQTPPQQQVQTPPPPSPPLPPAAGLPTPVSSRHTAAHPTAPADRETRRSTPRRHQRAREILKPQTRVNAGQRELGQSSRRRPLGSSTITNSVSAGIASPDPLPRPARPRRPTASNPATSPTHSSAPQTYHVMLTSSYGQIGDSVMAYPAPQHLLDASQEQERDAKGSWRLFEEDRCIKHMLDIRDEDQITGENRFREASDRLVAEGLDRGFYAVKNIWNRTGRARSGFDERKNKTAPLSTSAQGKKAKKRTSTKRKREPTISIESDDEQGDEPAPEPSPEPAPEPPQIYDDESLAKAESFGTRPKMLRLA